VSTIVCVHCQETVPANPRIKDQEYCGKPACQRARKTAWERQKIETDPDYRANRRESQKIWIDKHPEYYKAYRKRNPQKVLQNRIRQKLRNQKRANRLQKREDEKAVSTPDIAKTDALELAKDKLLGAFWLVPKIAKMDALAVQIIEITSPDLKDPVIAKKDSIATTLKIPLR
jgi:hypothetical protein